MTLQKSSHNFFVMFRESMKKSCLFSVLFFCFTTFFSGINFADKMWYKIKDPGTFASMSNTLTAFFFDDLIDGDGWFVVNFVVILFAVLTAIVLFNFQWSKKQCNVIYSLGMKRTEIYNAKILGGLVPMIGAMLTSLLLEILSNVIFESTLNGHFWFKVLYVGAQWIAVYSLAFLLCSVVFANTGNVVEGLIFGAILSVFTMVLYVYLNETRIIYTLGASEFDCLSVWNWNSPFLMNEALNGYNGGMPPQYFANPPEIYYGLYDFSGAISAAVYCIPVYLIGLFAIKKRKNENAGTFGKSKAAVEIASVAAGLYAMTAVLFIVWELTSNRISGTAMFIISCIAFLAVQIIFKLIFSSGRKTAIKKTVNRFPAYAAVFGAVTIVFALGFFSYAGYVPNVEDIKSVDVFMSEDINSNHYYDQGSVYGLKDMHVTNDIELYVDNPTIFRNSEEIKSITDIHKAIINDGKIKKTSPKACAGMLYLRYKLANGDVAIRVYKATTTETVKKIMSINDLQTSKNEIESQLKFARASYEIDAFLEEKIGEIEGKPVIICDGKTVYDKASGNYLGYVNFEYDDIGVDYTGAWYVRGYGSETDSSFEIEGFEKVANGYAGPYNSISFEECYLFPTDMTKGYNIWQIDNELFDALIKDLSNQSAAHYFMHKPEDEIGILSFGLSDSTVYNYDTGEVYYGEYTTEVEYRREYGNDDIVEAEVIPDISVGVGQYAEHTSWNISSSDITAIVVTKDMVNTIKYLESHDLMKYFTPSRKVSDIKCVKLATKEELFGKSELKQLSPVFNGAYWDSKTVSLYNDMSKEKQHIFNKIDNEITDIERITKLVDGSVVFGFCPNDYRIMEITYNDGSIATVLVSAEVYNSVMG